MQKNVSLKEEEEKAIENCDHYSLFLVVKLPYE